MILINTLITVIKYIDELIHENTIEFFTESIFYYYTSEEFFLYKTTVDK